MFGSLTSLFKLISKKVSVADALKFLEDHADHIDSVIDVALNRYYDRVKKILGKLKPTTIDRLIRLLQELK